MKHPKLTSLLIVLILMVISTRALIADTYLGAGINYMVSGPNPPSVAVIDAKWEGEGNYPWFLAINYRDDYAIWDYPVDQHAVFSGGKRIFKLDITPDLYGYVDFGLSIPSELSVANSSWLLFHERFGLDYKGVRLELSHSSNAGLAPPNEGETALILSYKVNF